jgi:hypothetical protein
LLQTRFQFADCISRVRERPDGYADATGERKQVPRAPASTGPPHIVVLQVSIELFSTGVPETSIPRTYCTTDVTKEQAHMSVSNQQTTEVPATGTRQQQLLNAPSRHLLFSSSATTSPFQTIAQSFFFLSGFAWLNAAHTL